MAIPWAREPAAPCPGSSVAPRRRQSRQRVWVREYPDGHPLAGTRNLIRKYYGRSVLALLLIPVAAMLAAGIFDTINPELAAGHADYARNYALLEHLRNGVPLATVALLGALWLLACIWLLRAKSRRRAWLWLALVGSAGFAVLTALSDHFPADSE
jgi:cytochrome bd-type quinol oxidase subunit 2